MSIKSIIVIPIFFFAISIIIISGIIINERFLSAKFEETKTNITLKQLENVWGKPDKILDDGKILFYHSIIGYEYVFSFDENDLLIHKYEGD